jgi:precorrin-6A/cobalt-precorrin-6A reductase
LTHENIDVLIDATHPFATQITANAAAACEAAGVPRLMLVRPSWTSTSADRWLRVEDGEAAAKVVIGQGFGQVFLATGRQELPAFAGLSGVHFLVRLVDEPAELLALDDYEVIQGRGPFVEAEEQALLKDRNIQAIVAKNAGGKGSWPKIAAARTLGLPVIMIDRTAPAEGDQMETVDDVLAWLR